MQLKNAGMRVAPGLTLMTIAATLGPPYSRSAGPGARARRYLVAVRLLTHAGRVQHRELLYQAAGNLDGADPVFEHFKQLFEALLWNLLKNHGPCPRPAAGFLRVFVVVAWSGYTSGGHFFNLDLSSVIR